MKIGILGATGRMGVLLLREVLAGGDACTLAAAVVRDQSKALGKDAGELAGAAACGVQVTADAEGAFKFCDLLIDFTVPDATLEHAALAAQYAKPLVCGTTGLTAVEEAGLAVAAHKAPVLYSANMSVGMTMLAAFVEQAASRLGPDDFDIEIFEAHHRYKTDAPSGTALLLGRAAAQGRGVRLDDAMIPTRFGPTGARITGSIGMSVFRGGDVVGDHTVTFAGEGERIEFSHKVSNRAVFARGALRGAMWLKDKPPGLYTMKDALGL
jgi:4-hydroxy-tetrahydrodipicolinate reductase